MGGEEDGVGRDALPFPEERREGKRAQVGTLGEEGRAAQVPLVLP